MHFNGVPHSVVGTSSAPGVRAPTELRAALLKALHEGLHASLESATAAIVSNALSQSRLLRSDRSAWQVRGEGVRVRVRVG